MHLVDYYITFAFLAGIKDPTDKAAAAAGLPALDGVNFWPRLSGENTTAPRTEIYGGPGWLVSGEYKLLMSPSEVYAVWTGPQSPNATTALQKQFFLHWNCSSCVPPVLQGRANCSAGCLFNVATDPSEHHELSQAEPEKLQELKRKFAAYQKTDFNPVRGNKDPRACAAATTLYGTATGCFWGPFAFLNSTARPAAVMTYTCTTKGLGSYCAVVNGTGGTCPDSSCGGRGCTLPPPPSRRWPLLPPRDVRVGPSQSTGAKTDDYCDASLLQNVAFSGDNIQSIVAVSTTACARACCALAACTAWTQVNRTAGGATCYLKRAAISEACEPGERCVSWSRSPPRPPLPPPPPPPHCAPKACDRGWSKDAEGCCTVLSLGSALRPAGVVAHPHGANLNATAWEDRAYPWGGDAQLSDDGSLVHGFFAEFAGHCPMTCGTWYSSTHIRHAVAPADASGLPSGPFVAKDVAVARAAGNPVLLKAKTADGFHVLFTTCQRFDMPVRNCSGRDPALWHKEAVYKTGNDSATMGVNLAYSRSLDGPWTARRNILENVALPYGLQAETNPAVVLLPNGTVLLAYKTWPLPETCRQLIGSATCKAIGIVSSQHWNGSYSHLPMGEEFAAVGANIEDPSLYRDPKSGALHMLLHTEASGGAGGSAHSTTSGKTWAFDYSKHAYDYTVTMSDGQQIKLTNREEPKLLLDAEGFPTALINQATVRELSGKDAPPPPGSPYKGPQSTHLTFTLMQPLLPALKTDEFASPPAGNTHALPAVGRLHRRLRPARNTGCRHGPNAARPSTIVCRRPPVRHRMAARPFTSARSARAAGAATIRALRSTTPKTRFITCSSKTI